ncbi:MAG: hypothetical protein H0V92_06145 [Pseudonocardiales bacterium]|nr:hypothetical protein [Pseudonocardiales bacterium]
MPDEEPEQRPDAAPRTAPAKKAPTKKAPAKKAAAKKAAAKKGPAKRAVKKAAPRATIMNRIQELEERMATEPVGQSSRPAVARPKVAPRQAPAEAGRGASEPDSVAVGEEPVVPVLDTPAVLPPVAAPVLPPSLPRANPRSDLTAVTRTTVDHGEPVRQQGDRSLVVRAMLVALVVLLSLAAGLTVAAIVKNMDSTWRAKSVVAITPPASGTAPESTGDAAARYIKTAETTEFAVAAAQLGGIPGEQVRGELKAHEGKAGEVVLDARAINADVAAALAEAASRQLTIEIFEDQAKRTDPPSRLGARILVPTSEAVRLQPTERAALLGGTLAAVNVLLIAVLLVIVVQRPSRRRR